MQTNLKKYRFMAREETVAGSKYCGRLLVVTQTLIGVRDEGTCYCAALAPS
jgi:hypothetical protein